MLKESRANSTGQRLVVVFVSGFETEPSHKKDGTTNYKAKNVTGGSAPLKHFGDRKVEESHGTLASGALDLAALQLQGAAGLGGIPGLQLAGLSGLGFQVPGLTGLPGMGADLLAQQQLVGMAGMTPGISQLLPTGLPMAGVAGMTGMAFDPAQTAPAVDPTTGAFAQV